MQHKFKAKNTDESRTGVLVCKIVELPQHLDHFQVASKTRKGENEDQANVTRFKYACGKNAAKIDSEIKAANIALAKISEPIEGFEDYLAARNAICEAHCLRDKERQPKFIGGPEDKENGPDKKYTFAPEALKKCRKEIERMEKVYKKVLNAKKAQVDGENKLLDETVSIKLHTFSWNDLPENISGTYLVVLTPMFTDIPEDN